MNRRDFIAGLTATAAGLLVPDRRIWALDRTMTLPPDPHVTIQVNRNLNSDIYKALDPDAVRAYLTLSPQTAVRPGHVIMVANEMILITGIDRKTGRHTAVRGWSLDRYND